MGSSFSVIIVDRGISFDDPGDPCGERRKEEKGEGKKKSKELVFF